MGIPSSQFADTTTPWWFDEHGFEAVVDVPLDEIEGTGADDAQIVRGRDQIPVAQNLFAIFSVKVILTPRTER